MDSNGMMKVAMTMDRMMLRPRHRRNAKEKAAMELMSKPRITVVAVINRELNRNR